MDLYSITVYKEFYQSIDASIIHALSDLLRLYRYANSKVFCHLEKSEEEQKKLEFVEP